MKNACVVFCILVCVTSATASQDQQPAYSQLELNRTAAQELREAEAEMFQLISELEFKVAANQKQLKELRACQKAWEAYREAQLNVLFPASSDQRPGTAHPMCVLHAQARMTRLRTKELHSLVRPPEGDVCAAFWRE